MAKRNKLSELTGEFRVLVVQRSNLVDAVLAPLVFLVLNAFVGLQAAAWGSLGLAATLTGIRLAAGRSLGYALGGLGTTAVAILATRLFDRPEGFFVPALATSGLIVLGCVASVIVRRPLVAWTSYLVRRWPLEWYWHCRVRPAYTEVTLFWAAYFALRLALQWFLFQEAGAGILGLLNLMLGWPATIVLLVLSYLYGTWRLQSLGGPSVEEFNMGVDSPWDGQQRGF